MAELSDEWAKIRAVLKIQIQAVKVRGERILADGQLEAADLEYLDRMLAALDEPAEPPAFKPTRTYREVRLNVRVEFDPWKTSAFRIREEVTEALKDHKDVSVHIAGIRDTGEEVPL